MHASYANLGKDLKVTFDDVLKQLNDQETEAARLRKEITEANNKLLAANSTMQQKLQSIAGDERRHATEDRQQLLSQITTLVNATAETQERRLTRSLKIVVDDVAAVNSQHRNSLALYSDGMDSWCENSEVLVNALTKSRESTKTRIKTDFDVSI